MWFDFRALDTLHEGLRWRRPSLPILRPPPSSHLGVCASPPPCRGGAAVGRARLEHQQHAAGARQRAKVGSLPCACAAVHAPLTARLYWLPQPLHDPLLNPQCWQLFFSRVCRALRPMAAAPALQVPAGRGRRADYGRDGALALRGLLHVG